MRVAIVASPHYPIPPVNYGGTERVIWYQIKGLRRTGHTPILLAPGDSQVDCELVPVAKKAIYFPKTTNGLPKFNAQMRRIETETKRQLQKLLPGIDIIHSHGFDLLDFKHFANLTTLHGPVTFEQIKYYHRRQALFYASISKNQQGALPNLNWVATVYNGEDPREFPKIKQPQNYVCFLGRFDREKNPHLAIELAINFGIKIKLAGKIDFLGNEYFEQEVKKYLAHPLVEYLGELDTARKIDLLAHAKCNLHPTGFREPFGLTILEAAYCGTPTLAIAKGSMPELIQEGSTGVLVEDFVEGYHQLETCFKLNRTHIARRARLLFNYEKMADDYIKAYEKVLRRQVSHK